MRKLFLGLLVLTGIAVGGWWLVKNQIGDIRPALLPASLQSSFLSKNSNQAKDEQLTHPENLISTSTELGTFQIPQGFQIEVFADTAQTMRDLAFSSGQTLLGSSPASGTVLAFPDENQDRRADQQKIILSDLDKPHGLAFYNNWLFVAEETNVKRYIWNEENQTAELDKTIVELPKGGRHFSRTLAITPEGVMYISLGSSCDVCEEKHPWLAAVVVTTVEGENTRLFASGLRNAPFITLHPQTQQLWGTEMGRDFLGDTLPPDEINTISEGQNYGWPKCYGNQVFDQKYSKGVATDCQNTISPVFELPAHVAPLGLAFITPSDWPAEWQGDLLVALHGSWNSTEPVGYKIVRLDVEEETVTKMTDFVTGFLEGSSAGRRPVDVEFDQNGQLFISDDKAGAIYTLFKAE